jgi:squalene-hopene/tetraprenyl-beta-curcumene cyclase
MLNDGDPRRHPALPTNRVIVWGSHRINCGISRLVGRITVEVSAISPDRLRAAYQTARDALLAERTPAGHWIGELSSSALATATAVTALAVVARSAGRQPKHESLIDAGLQWLTLHQNADGGWGDTVKSISNISTTMLCRAAFHVTGRADRHADALERCEDRLAEHFGRTPAELAEAVRQRYGRDRTFSVPILMMCALAGLVPWREVPRLPFEAACLPQSWYRLARMPVVSYALPALIAIGQVVHHHRSTWNPITWVLRRLGRRRSLHVLERIQPSSGGYLEATPLTSFVVMSLAAMRVPSHLSPPETGEEGVGVTGVEARTVEKQPRSGGSAHPPLPPPLSPRFGGREGQEGPADRVIARGVEFIVNSARADGSWPIDTNLSIWVTTLSVNALAAADDLERLDSRDTLASWLLAQQTKEVHPYTGAEPGAWGWSDEPGSVPDCDDTPGAVLALENLTQDWKSGRGGSDWIKELQNRDGGWPTFCRGWGKLPFDRSGSDLTAHALRAMAVVVRGFFGRLPDGWGGQIIPPRNSKQESHGYVRVWWWTDTLRGLQYLSSHQRSDGSWLPLWFGNQHAPDDINPVYGTARVLAAYRDLNQLDTDEARRGISFLLDVQNSDGGWGGARATPSSVEETALAVEILIELAPPEARAAVERGIEYLVRRVEDGTFTDASPIGFYFAKLWYFEKLYPIIFTVAALGRAARQLPTGNL